MSDDADAVFAAERPGLTRLAYRMLGGTADAEDAVQEGFVRWLRLDPLERARIENPGAWLTRATSRICLDVLGSARHRRETYVGPWLPEPLAADDALAADPLERAVLDDSVSVALQLVLDALTPAERVAFVMHDVFDVPFADIAATVGRSVDASRQLATSARRKVRSRRDELAPRERHDAVARAFAAASGSGDLDGLLAVLDPTVVLTSDGGGRVSAARRPVTGAENVARFVIGVLSQHPRARIDPVHTADGLGFVVSEHGRVDSVLVLGVRDARVSDVWLVRNPDKLTRWIVPADMPTPPKP